MSLTLAQVLYAYNTIPEVGPVTLTKIMNLFPDPTAAWQANGDELLNIAKLPPKIITVIMDQRPKLDPISLWAELEQNQIKIITIADNDYPALLRQIYTPPPILTYRGQLPPSPCVAMVGTRHCTNYGRTVASQLAHQLVKHEVTIISGLARGIDAIAHQAAMDGRGHTLAMVGTGLNWDILYPAEHYQLAEQIIDANGCVMSELAFSTPALPANFPRRNRLISGLAQATIIIEGDVKSGAMITAKWALEQNREVLAVPGPITSPQSNGPNQLIKNGAVPVLSVADILIAIGLETNDAPLPPIINHQPQPAFDLAKLSSIAQKIIDELSNNQEVTIDQLLQKLNLPADQGAAAITELELEGLIAKEGVIVRMGC